MNCRKRKYDLDEIVNKAGTGKELDHCEELYYLVHVFHMPEEEAEQILYQAKEESRLRKTGSSTNKP